MNSYLISFSIVFFVSSIIMGYIEFYFAKKCEFDCSKCKVFGCRNKTCMKYREDREHM